MAARGLLLMALPLAGFADTTLVFNEVMYHPAASEPALEWIEFYNQMAVDLDVSGWRVVGDVDYAFPAGARVPGQGYLVLGLDPVALKTATGLSEVWGPYTNRLSNGGGTLVLQNRDGRRMDRVRFEPDGDWPVTADGAGVSLAKRDRDTGSEPAASWTASEQLGGTPGRENFPSPGQPTLAVTFNELSGLTNGVFWFELLNRSPDPVNLEGWMLRLDQTNDLDAPLPAGLVLGSGERVAFDETVLGARPASGDRLFLFTPNLARVADGVVVSRRPLARRPEGTGRWLHPAEPTPGTSNRFALEASVVINEIMYHHALDPAASGLPSTPAPEQWIELYNRGSNTVDLSGWELAGGVGYRFGIGQQLRPGSYLIVAKDAASLRAAHPTIDLVGDFSGRLGRRSDRVVLTDAFGNPADEVRYFDGGHWPGYADGGGSSLELQDPQADNARAEAWAASDESGRTAWETVSYRMIAGYPAGSQPTQWNDFILGLLDAGECLIDDVRVIESPAGTPVPLVGNGDFENGLAGWRLLGTHRRSRVISDPDQPGNHVLELLATGPQEHMHNHIETTLLNGRSVVNGREYEVSFRARWRAGNNRLNTRLYFNRVARTTALARPAASGTPGAPNSRRIANLGPTFGEFRHDPVIPNPNAPVTVSALIEDPQGVASASLWWSANGGAWNTAPMTADTAGRYQGSIPGRLAGAVVQFYIQATDGAGAAAAYPPAGRDSGALYAVKDTQVDFRRGHNLRLLLTPANRDLLHAFTNVMSNEELPATVIYDERRAHYDVGLRLKGSQRGRYSNTRVSYHLAFQPDDGFRGVHPVMLVDRSGAGDSTSNKQLEILIKHLLARAGGVAATHADLCRVIAPLSTHTGSALLAPRHEDEFIETAWENGGDGSVFELELIYYPTSANAAGYKNPQPDNVLGVDIQDLGPDPELYRYNFLIKNHRDADDYRPFLRFARALSQSGTTLERQGGATMDVEAWLRAWALVTLCGVGDSYTFGNDHNLLMFSRPEDGRFVPFPVDLDFSFVRGTPDPLIGDRNLSRLISLPANRRSFYAHVLDLIASVYNPDYLDYWITHYNSFVPDQNFAWVRDYVRQRGSAATASINAAGGNTPFALTSPTRLTTATNLVTLTGTAPVTLRTLTINGVEWPLTWSSVSQWSVRVPVTAADTQLELSGIDRYGQVVPGATAMVTVTYTGPVVEPEGRVLFNEIMYHPAAPDASYVELINTATDTAFDLSDWRIAGLDFQFPAGSLLEPGAHWLLAGDWAGFVEAYPSGTPLPGAVFPGNLRNEGETLTLLRPGPVAGEERVVDQVRYDSRPPWPAAANGLGPSLQLIDPAQDNRRVANWAAVPEDAETTLQWVYVVALGNASSSGLYLYLESAGDLYVDDLRIVAGTDPELGPNLVLNGDFESPLSGSWVVAPNHAASTLSTAVTHSGNSSLHLVASTGGTTRASAISQDLAPALVTGQPYALSFWYRQSTNGGPFTVRLSGWGISVTVDPTPTRRTSHTPGTANSVTQSLSPFPSVWLNEAQPLNLNGPLDNLGEREPWIELYNPGPQPVNLDGLFLANQFAALNPWTFPPGLTLGAGEFLVVWADGEPTETTGTNLHTSFRLDDSDEGVVLGRPGADAPQILDYLTVAGVGADQSSGSVPDGEPYARQVLFHPTPGTTNTADRPPATVLINEWMALNTSATGIADPADNRFQDWFELFNPGDQSVSLDAWALSDVLTNQFKFRIPAGYSLAPRGYLLVWADEETDQNQAERPDLHVNFRLSQEGEAIVLTRPDGTISDAITFGVQPENVSQGRSPDGAASVQFLPTPTPRGANAPPPAPLLTGIQVSDTDGVVLTVAGITGRRYQLESADDLESPDWTSLGPAQLASGPQLVFHDAGDPRTRRFYRVVLLP